MKTNVELLRPQEFFRELVLDALNRLKLRIQPETEFYLVNLLSGFMSTERLFPRDADGHIREEPLVFMVKEALEQSELHHQKLMFRQVGDVSLYVAGYFPDSLNRKLVDVDYYIEVGETAYQQVASRVEEQAQRGLFEELSEKFSGCVEVLAEVSDRTAQKRETDLIAAYERWERTGSERAAKLLAEAGILPASKSRKSLQ